MDGVLVIDKPEGLTSHDVVAVARRILSETRIGHTGTLDPLATGVLPLAIGRATRLVRFLSTSDKDYDATIRFGLTTDSFDITGTETSRSNREPDRDAVLGALRSLSGQYFQTPPAFSAKKVAGRRAYSLARIARGSEVAEPPSDAMHKSPGRPVVELAPVRVDVSRVELTGFDGRAARVAVTCSAGFYVRSFAHALGERVGTGACLEALRRTRSGEFTLEAAVTVQELQRGSGTERLIPMARLLTRFPEVRVTAEGRKRVSHGQSVESSHLAAGKLPLLAEQEWARLLDEDGKLVAIGTAGASASSLRPAVVLI
jgi:tRNA pseudouridine55 synthase